MFSFFAAAAQPPPFLLDDANLEVGLKFVFFGSEPQLVERHFRTVSVLWPQEQRTQIQVASAANHPEEGATFFIQRMMPESEWINGHRVRLHVFASTAPIEGPESLVHALTLRQAACVVVLGSNAKTITVLDSLLTEVESKPKRPPVIVCVGRGPDSVPQDWKMLTAVSPAEAVEIGLLRVAELIK